MRAMVTPRGTVSDELRDALVQASFQVVAALTVVGAGYDLSLTQLRMLGVLRGRELRMAELAAVLGLDRSTVTGLVDRAARRGLVARVRRVPRDAAGGSDGRAVHVVLTEQAELLGQRVAGEVSDAIAPLVSTLTGSDRQRLTALLDRMPAPGWPR